MWSAIDEWEMFIVVLVRSYIIATIPTPYVVGNRRVGDVYRCTGEKLYYFNHPYTVCGRQ